MIARITFWILGFAGLIARSEAQTCDCQSDFDFVIEKMEQEHPGFDLNVTDANRSEYQHLIAEVKAAIADSVQGPVDCSSQIERYLDFFLDNHVSISVRSEEAQEAYGEKVRTKLTPQLTWRDEVMVVRLPSFNYRLWRELDHFYDSIAPLIPQAKGLIVDVRNNGGGGERMYGQMLKIIRKSKKRTVVMWNRYCASACEEFAMKVSDYKHVTTMGENSNGTFAYGMIKGLTTPACGLRFIITTERYRDRLQYEKVGFPPLIALTASDDWMEQAYRVVGE